MILTNYGQMNVLNALVVWICFAIDALHSKDGKDVIIELNATAIGFHSNYYEEDSTNVRDLVVEKMSELFPAKKALEEK